MIDLTQDDDGVVVVRIEGTIGQSEYRSVMPRVQGMLSAAAEPISAVLAIAEDAEIEPSVLWDDMKFGETNASQVARLAVVGPPKWQGYVELLQDAQMESQLFAVGELAAARDWAKSTS